MTETKDHDTVQTDQVLSMAAQIVSAYASHNQMPQSDLPGLITSIHATLAGLSGEGGAAVQGADATAAAEAPLVPAVPIDASITDEAIICLENGKPFKTLKRHLATQYGMTPDQYRERWGLSKDYPMVAPAYSKKRADTAKKIGLGRKPGTAAKKKKT